ncbi:protein RCC2-like [Protobothrops mucrosquamatus]|uniref:protein RCC2-like n=1 Tax=Protobothrops mucrosquamatus TaxID=103944 RepID=UPI00077592DF|nr:protein RCC2-like [Protobothrops mucrosquamatus]
MPRRKADAASSGNGTGVSRKRASTGRGPPLTAKRKNRGGGGSSSSSSNNGGGGSSGEEQDGLVLPLLSAPGGSKKTPRSGGGREQQSPPGLQSPQAAVVVSEPEHTKERIKLEGSKCKGQLLIFGATNWDLIGRKEVPKQQAAYRNLGQNLWGPHRYGCLSGIQIRTAISGPCAAHSLFITVEGKLWSWGRNDKGQLGHGDTKRVDAPKPIEVLSSETVVSAACGRNHTLALTENGAVFAFGENKMGQLGLGNQTDAIPSPTQIMYNGQPITKVACGAEFSMIMDCKGNLYSFGCPEYGQLGHNSDGKFIARAQRIEYDCELVPRRVAIFIEKTKDGQILPVPNIVVRDVACGANHTGYGDHKPKSSTSAQEVKTLDGIYTEQVAMGYAHSLAIARDDNEAEKEKIKKLPEYNPRTL